MFFLDKDGPFPTSKLPHYKEKIPRAWGRDTSNYKKLVHYVIPRDNTVAYCNYVAQNDI